MTTEKYVWIVDSENWANRFKVFDNEKSAWKYANDHASGFSGFEGNYALSVTKVKVES